jgi:hypothetical protein
MYDPVLYVYEFLLSLLSGLLGILLMALSGLRTLTVRIADRFNFSTSRQYSRALKQKVKFSLAICCIPGPLTESKNSASQLAVFLGPSTESKTKPRNWQYSRALKQKVKYSLAIGSIPGPLNRKLNTASQLAVFQGP